MKIAEYATLPHRWPHRIAALAFVLIDNGIKIHSGAFGTRSAKWLAIQLIATWFIWCSNDGITSHLSGKWISYRTIAWLVIAGVPLSIWLSTRIWSLVLP